MVAVERILYPSNHTPKYREFRSDDYLYLVFYFPSFSFIRLASEFNPSLDTYIDHQLHTTSLRAPLAYQLNIE